MDQPRPAPPRPPSLSRNTDRWRIRRPRCAAAGLQKLSASPRWLCWAALWWCYLGAGATGAQAATAPHVAIVQCEQHYQQDWFDSDGTAHSLVGLAGLVGVRYETLTLSELLAAAPTAYNSLWFGACQWVSEANYQPLVDRLDSLLAAGGSVFVVGPIGIYYLDGSQDSHYRGMDQLAPILGVKDGGYHGPAGFAVETTSSTHPIALRAGYAMGAELTLSLDAIGQSMVPYDWGAATSEILLELRSAYGDDDEPFLVVAEPQSGARVAAIGEYGGNSRVAAPLLTSPTLSFFDNQLLPYLVDTLVWLLAKDESPYAGLQLSHASMTMIGRLDGDESDDYSATDTTLDYLIALGEQTGFATVYGIVSNRASQGGVWWLFHHRGDELQDLGGSLASHSRSHPNQMSGTLNAAAWQAEVAGSLQDLRNELTDANFSPHAFAFINPGNTIRSADYPYFFGDIELYMTHGFELRTPYGSGVQGFGSAPPTAVINNVPAPDYQWLYSPSWTSTVAEATLYQAHLLDYYNDTVERGVLYNQMWHDYAIGNESPPPHDPNAESTWPLFDTVAEHHGRSRVYLPSAPELVAKMHLAAATGITSSWSAGTLEVTLDYSNVDPGFRAHVAGMGLRIHQAAAPIRSVAINGQAHPAFFAETVILPAASGAAQTVSIQFGASPLPEDRLTYASKAIAGLEITPTGLTATIATPGLAMKFCFAAPTQALLLRVDAFAREPGGELCGQLRFANPQAIIELQRLNTGATQTYVKAAERGISSAVRYGNTVTLAIQPGPEGKLVVGALYAPLAVKVDGDAIAFDLENGEFHVPLPASESNLVVEILLDGCLDLGGSCGGPSDASVIDAWIPDLPIDAGIPDAPIDAWIPDPPIDATGAQDAAPDTTNDPDAAPVVPLEDAGAPPAHPRPPRGDLGMLPGESPEPPARGEERSAGCYCAASPDTTPWVGLLIAALGLFRRRRRGRPSDAA